MTKRLGLMRSMQAAGPVLGHRLGGSHVAAVAMALGATHSTLTPYLAIPMVIIAMGARIFWGRRR
jgi:hypothetical protein